MLIENHIWSFNTFFQEKLFYLSTNRYLNIGSLQQHIFHFWTIGRVVTYVFMLLQESKGLYFILNNCLIFATNLRRVKAWYHVVPISYGSLLLQSLKTKELWQERSADWILHCCHMRRLFVKCAWVSLMIHWQAESRQRISAKINKAPRSTACGQLSCKLVKQRRKTATI